MQFSDQKLVSDVISAYNSSPNKELTAFPVTETTKDLTPKIKTDTNIINQLRKMSDAIERQGQVPEVSIKDREVVTLSEAAKLCSQFKLLSDSSVIYEKLKNDQPPEHHYSSPEDTYMSIETVTAENIYEQCGRYFDEQWNPTDLSGWEALLIEVSPDILQRLIIDHLSTNNGFDDDYAVRISAIEAYVKASIPQMVEEQGLGQTITHITQEEATLESSRFAHLARSLVTQHITHQQVSTLLSPTTPSLKKSRDNEIIWQEFISKLPTHVSSQ